MTTRNPCRECWRRRNLKHWKVLMHTWKELQFSLLKRQRSIFSPFFLNHLYIMPRCNIQVVPYLPHVSTPINPSQKTLYSWTCWFGMGKEFKENLEDNTLERLIDINKSCTWLQSNLKYHHSMQVYKCKARCKIWWWELMAIVYVCVHVCMYVCVCLCVCVYSCVCE